MMKGFSSCNTWQSLLFVLACTSAAAMACQRAAETRTTRTLANNDLYEVKELVTDDPRCTADNVLKCHVVNFNENNLGAETVTVKDFEGGSIELKRQRDVSDETGVGGKPYKSASYESVGAEYGSMTIIWRGVPPVVAGTIHMPDSKMFGIDYRDGKHILVQRDTSKFLPD